MFKNNTHTYTHTHAYTHSLTHTPTIKLPYVGNEIEFKWENKVIWQIKFNGNQNLHQRGREENIFITSP